MIVGFFDQARMVAGWCELRGEFRHFRTDRITEAEFLEERYGLRPAVLRARWKRSLSDRREAAPPASPAVP